MKLVHNRMNLREDFTLGMKVPLYDLRLHQFLGKLRSGWMGSFVVTYIFFMVQLRYRTLLLELNKRLIMKD